MKPQTQRLRTAVLSLLLILSLLAACAGGVVGKGGDAEAAMPGQDEKTADITLTSADDGSEFEVRAGGVVGVELESTGGTGYSWYPEPLDEAVLRPAGMKSSPLSETKKPGGMMLGTWYFEAVSPGRAVIRLLYYRVWEGKQRAIKSFEASIVVREMP